MKTVPGKRKREIAAAAVLLFLLSALPLLLIGRYDWPGADDFSYGLAASRAWAGTHSLLRVLEAAAGQAAATYHTWQGSFCAVFLMALQPAAFGEAFYRLTPILLLGAYALASLFFLSVVMRRYLGLGGAETVAASFLLLTVSVQFTYSAVESFYWYNGGVYYTFFYSLGLVLLGLVLLEPKAAGRPVKILCRVFAPVLAFLVGGGNYTTALTAQSPPSRRRTPCWSGRGRRGSRR